jgi:hypothetical protein
MYSPSFQNFSVAYWFLVAGAFLINLFIAFLVGNAARSKGRSFGSFFWLSFFVGFVVPALVVAALPFRIDDPRRPGTKTTY